ncbi:MAG: HAD-IB family hydrolase [Pseudomonadota bacterium]|nr:HAD-IB family hydrolase [Pseudomonadota bacterium]
MDLILFDLDNTLLSGDSDYEWAQYLIEKGVRGRAEHEVKNLQFYQQYKSGTLDIHEFLDYQLKPLASYPQSVLKQWRDDYVATRIEPIMTAKARELVNSALRQTDYVLIITATNRFVTETIATAFGVKYLIGTEPEEINGEFTGKVAGTPSFREGKITRLEEWFDARDLDWNSFAMTRFYSDSLNDLPLLNKVDQPIAVDPDDILLSHALAKRWPVISLRD